MSEFLSHFIYFLFISSVSQSSVSLIFLWVTWTFSKFHLDLFKVFFKRLLCMVLLVVAVGVTRYIYNLPQSPWINVLPLQVKCKQFLSLLNLKIWLSLVLSTTSDGVIIVASKVKYDLGNSWEFLNESIIFTPIFIHFDVLFSFLKFQPSSVTISLFRELSFAAL